MFNKITVKLCYKNFQQYKIRIIFTILMIIFFTTIALLTDNEDSPIVNQIITAEHLVKNNNPQKLFKNSSNRESIFSDNLANEILTFASGNIDEINKHKGKNNNSQLICNTEIVQSGKNISAKLTHNIALLNCTADRLIVLNQNSSKDNFPINISKHLLINIILFLLTVTSLSYILLTTILTRLKDCQTITVLGENNYLAKIIFYEAFFICLIILCSGCFLSVFFTVLFGKLFFDNYLQLAIIIILATILAGIISLNIFSKLRRITDELS